MNQPHRHTRTSRQTAASALLSLLLLHPLASFAAPQAARAQATPQESQGEIIGTIEGQAIALKGPMSAQVVGSEVKTLLRSGVDVRVKAGQARVELTGGGTIIICGPAHISMLKAGNALTIALDSGTIHAHIEGKQTLNIFTAAIVAKAIAIGEGPQDVLVGFDTPGLMCVRAGRGAVRLEEQFGSQSVVVPQGSDVTLNNGQLDTMRVNNALCACEAYAPQTERASNAGPNSSPEVSVLASNEELRKGSSGPKTPPPQPAPSAVDPPKPAVGPTYQVFMPPLRYDASQAVQDEPDPKLIMLVRRVRVRPTIIFESRVAGDPVTQTAKALAASAKPQNESSKPANPASASLVDRVKNFLKSLWTPSS